MNQWPDIGEKLQKAREKRELSLADVTHEIRIPQATLQALESDDYSGFSDSAYAKSFLYQYSEYLKVNADQALQAFETNDVLEETEGIEYLNKKTSSSSSAVTAKMLIRPLLTLLLIALVIGGGVWGFSAVEKHLEANRTPVFTPVVESELESAPSASEPSSAVIPMTRAKNRTQLIKTPEPQEENKMPSHLKKENGTMTAQ